MTSVSYNFFHCQKVSMNSKLAEDDFLLSILIDLKGYEEHNKEELDYIIQVVKHRKDQLESTLLGNPKTQAA